MCRNQFQINLTKILNYTDTSQPRPSTLLSRTPTSKCSWPESTRRPSSDATSSETWPPEVPPAQPACASSTPSTSPVPVSVPTLEVARLASSTVSSTASRPSPSATVSRVFTRDSLCPSRESSCTGLPTSDPTTQSWVFSLTARTWTSSWSGVLPRSWPPEPASSPTPSTLSEGGWWCSPEEPRKTSCTREPQTAGRRSTSRREAKPSSRELSPTCWEEPEVLWCSSSTESWKRRFSNKWLFRSFFGSKFLWKFISL